MVDPDFDRRQAEGVLGKVGFESYLMGDAVQIPGRNMKVVGSLEGVEVDVQVNFGNLH
jgi:hypothetical protein